jgi:hypothetical protein
VTEANNPATAVPGDPSRVTGALPEALTGLLHVFVAFDWGEEVNLARAQAIVPSEARILPRRRHTPSSITYRPPPLRFALQPTFVELPILGRQEAAAEAIVFDFAAASVSLHIPFTLATSQLSQVAASLAKPESLQQVAAEVLRPLYEKLAPAIERSSWGEVTEEYFVFQFSPDELPAGIVLAQSSKWLAGMVRLDDEPLFADEVAEALRQQIRYGRDDLLVADWAAAVLIDRDCDETLQTIEFANLQLLEFREIDARLDDRLAATYGVVHSLARRWLPFWRPYTGQLRTLGDLKVEANTVFERTQNALKLVGDQYLARVYRLLASRFHLDDWEQSIQRSLNVIEAAYRVLADQAAAWRSELLELMIVLLILVEIVLTLTGF